MTMAERPRRATRGAWAATGASPGSRRARLAPRPTDVVFTSPSARPATSERIGADDVVAMDRDLADLGGLADDDEQGDAVEVAVADRE